MSLAIIIFVFFGLYLLVATFHSKLGPSVYGKEWPGHYSDPYRKRVATARCVLLGIACMLLAVITFLQSFSNDMLTIISLVLLALCAFCVLIGLALGSSFRERP